jgi:nucleotide-binding universal stress UspA family protein
MAAVASAPVVAGVDGTSDGRVATRYAAELADRLGRSLTLLHAYHRSAVLNPLLPIVDPRASGQATLAVAHAAYAPSLNAGIMRSAGEHELRIAERDARAACPTVEVRTELVPGSPAKAMIDASARASVVVLGRSRLGDVERVLAGSVGSAVVAHATSPVIVVPSDWDSDAAERRVVLGLAGAASEVAAIEFALDIASRSGRRLAVAHADHGLDPAYRGSPELEAQAVELREHDRRIIAEAMAGWAERYPQVSIECLVSEERATDMLLRQAEGATLVVVGARGSGGFAGLMLGSTARAVAMHASCPVAVVR